MSTYGIFLHVIALLRVSVRVVTILNGQERQKSICCFEI